MPQPCPSFPLRVKFSNVKCTVKDEVHSQYKKVCTRMRAHTHSIEQMETEDELREDHDCDSVSLVQ